jgi:hypothetical protein
MNNGRFRFRIITPMVLALIGSFILVSTTSCASRETKGRKVVEDFLKNQGLRDLKVDLFHTSKEHPDKAYISVTVTYNYATSDGSFQREMLGYILKQDGQRYTIEQNTTYTKDQQKAEDLLAGKKPTKS